jgi:hypothetical protein
LREEVRKVRSDKKIDVKPIVSIEIYNLVHDLHYVTGLPLKDICEYFCVQGYISKEVIEHIFCSYLKYDIWIGGTLHYGDSSRSHSRYLKVEGKKKKVSIRFSQDFYQSLHKTSYCMALTPTSCCRLILERSLLNITIVDEFLKKYTSSINDIDENRKRVLKKAIKYIKRNSPYPQNDLSATEIIKLLFQEVKGMLTRV